MQMAQHHGVPVCLVIIPLHVVLYNLTMAEYKEWNVSKTGSGFQDDIFHVLHYHSCICGEKPHSDLFTFKE